MKYLVKAILFLFLTSNSLSINAQSSFIFRESFKIGNSVNGPPTIGATSDTGNVMVIFVANSSGSPSNFNMTRINKTGNLIWSKNYGLPAFEWAYNPIELSDNNLLVSGQTSTGDVLVLKTDAGGNKLWAKSIGTSENEYSLRCLEENFNSYFICAATGNHPNTDYLLLNLDSTGTLIWSKRFGSNNYDDPFSFTRTFDKGFAFIGRTQGFGAGQSDFYLVRLDSLGNILWSRTFGGSFQDYGRDIIETNDKGLLMTGITSSFGSTTKGLIIKIDSVGNFLWSKTYENAVYMELDKCTKMPDGNVVVTSAITPSLFKIDNSGNVLWSYLYNNYFGGFSCLNANNDIAMVGLTWNPDSLTFFKSDMNGLSCEQTNSPLTVNTVSLNIDSPITILFPFTPTNSNYNLPVTNNTPQTHYNCITITTGIDSEYSDLSNNLKVLVYPNPTYKFATIEINKNVNNWTWKVYNLLGENVMQIDNVTGNLLTFNSKELNNGIYLFQIETPTETLSTGKIIIAN